MKPTLQKKLNLINSVAEPYINKFTWPEDKEAYIQHARSRITIKNNSQITLQPGASSVNDELRRAYAETVSMLLIQRGQAYLVKISDKATQDAVQHRFTALSQSFIESSIALLIDFERLSLSIFTTLNKIQENTEFIRNHAAECHSAAEDASASFIDQVMTTVIAGPKTQEALKNAIFDAKLRVVIELHAIAFQKEQDESKMHIDFRKMAELFVKRISAKAEKNFSDDELIVSAISNAKDFIRIRAKLVSDLLIEIKKLESFANREDCLVQKDIKDLIKNIFYNIDALNETTSLEDLQGHNDALLQLINESSQFLEAKNELTTMLVAEMSYTSAVSKKTEGLAIELRQAKSIEAVKAVADEMSNTPEIIKPRGKFGAFSMFSNPIIKKLDVFIKRCSSNMQVKSNSSDYPCM